MFRDIARYVRNCPNCLANKPLQRAPAGTLHARLVEGPWEQVSVDLMGPLPRSTNGHTSLLVLQDRFTKWVEMQPLRGATTQAVIKALSDRLFYRHGSPSLLITDNGRQFRAREFAALLQSFQVKHQTSPVYAPHCNPVERANRTVKTMIRQYVGRDHRNWDRHLGALQFAMNTAQQASTGYSPAFLNHGRELRAPGATPPLQATVATPPNEQQYNLRRRPWKLRVGEQVWKRDHPLSTKTDAYAAKLAPRYLGPLTVRRLVSPVIADLQDEAGRWYRHVHVQDLKPAPVDHVPAEQQAALGAAAASPSNAGSTRRYKSRSREHPKQSSSRFRDGAKRAKTAAIVGRPRDERRRREGRAGRPNTPTDADSRHDGATLRRESPSKAEVADEPAAASTTATTRAT
ncbi:uncharacterized protein LOC116853147 [Odontomachus brunneus]|uniref:uncharacterized protein LOC116853147 n=1 Tax=Odontomachus brunneus TaxID=486640 RepID=UPI0013F1F9AE|nr:uncharacterized protein LOC116853147 [Odontomachus brunneus]